MNNVVSIKSKQEFVSFQPTSHCLVDRSKLQEMLIETSTDLDYEDFTKETGLYIYDIELLNDPSGEDILLEWFIDQKSPTDQDLVWEFYFNFLYDRYADEFDPYDVFSNPFQHYSSNWLSNK